MFLKITSSISWKAGDADLYSHAMEKVGVIVNKKRSHAENSLRELGQLAQDRGLSLFAEDSVAAELMGAKHLTVESFGSNVDVALAMGGDGTVLYAARKLHSLNIPIMGINLGSLGFLTSVGDQTMGQALDAIKLGQTKISSRAVAECRLSRSGAVKEEDVSLNDIVLGWGGSSRIVTLELSIDEQPVGRFMCDGMMVSTPTGSTGHSLSAGGPIVHPGVGGFTINVICPHTLSSRPLVVPDRCRIGITVEHAIKELILSIDGQDSCCIEQGDQITVTRSDHDIQFMQLADHSYFSVLSQKLHWRGSAL